MINKITIIHFSRSFLKLKVILILVLSVFQSNRGQFKILKNIKGNNSVMCIKKNAYIGPINV